MKLIAKIFSQAIKIIDKFPVQKLILDAPQDIWIKHRCNAIDKYNEKIYQSKTFANGNTVKRLLARSSYLLYKTKVDWTQQQQQRA